MGKQRFDVTQVIRNIDDTEATTFSPAEDVCKACGQPILKRKPFTLKAALVRCLVNEETDPRTGRVIPTPGPERYQHVKLALRIEEAKKEVRLSHEEIVDLKTLTPKFLTKVGQFRVDNILDPPDDEEANDGRKEDDSV